MAALTRIRSAQHRRGGGCRLRAATRQSRRSTRRAAVISNLGRLRLRLGRPGRRSRRGAGARTAAGPSSRWPTAGFSSLIVSRMVKAGGRPRTPGGPPRRHRAHADQQQLPERPHHSPPSARHSCWPTPICRRRPMWASPPPSRPAGSTCGHTTPPMSSVGPPSARCSGLGLRPIVNAVTPGSRRTRRGRPKKDRGMSRTDVVLKRL